MAANNLYFPPVPRVYTMTSDHYVVIDDKKTGLPRKINVIEFFAAAAAMGLIPAITDQQIISSETVDLTAALSVTINIPLAGTIIDISLYDTGGTEIDGVDVTISAAILPDTGLDITFDVNAFLPTVLDAQIIYTT